MAEVVVEELELDGTPEPLEGAREDAIDEAAPQLGEAGFDALTNAAEQTPLGSRGIGRGQQQEIGLLGEVLPQGSTAIAEVCQNDPPVAGPAQRQATGSIVPVARAQQGAEHRAALMDEGVEFEAEEPARAVLPEGAALLAQQTHAAVANGLAQGNG